MRKRLSKIVEESGCTVWQKPFMALRSSLRTELQDSRIFSDVQLDNWFDHTTLIATRHYYMPTKEGFENAARYESKLKLSSAVQQSAQQGPERTSQGELQNVESEQTMAVSPERYPKKCPSVPVSDHHDYLQKLLEPMYSLILEGITTLGKSNEYTHQDSNLKPSVPKAYFLKNPSSYKPMWVNSLASISNHVKTLVFTSSNVRKAQDVCSTKSWVHPVLPWVQV